MIFRWKFKILQILFGTVQEPTKAFETYDNFLTKGFGSILAEKDFDSHQFRIK